MGVEVAEAPERVQRPEVRLSQGLQTAQSDAGD